MKQVEQLETRKIINIGFASRLKTGGIKIEKYYKTGNTAT